MTLTLRESGYLCAVHDVPHGLAGLAEVKECVPVRFALRPVGAAERYEYENAYAAHGVTHHAVMRHDPALDFGRMRWLAMAGRGARKDTAFRVLSMQESTDGRTITLLLREVSMDGAAGHDTTPPDKVTLHGY